jgi:hypothetical protein
MPPISSKLTGTPGARTNLGGVRGARRRVSASKEMGTNAIRDAKTPMNTSAAATNATGHFRCHRERRLLPLVSCSYESTRLRGASTVGFRASGSGAVTDSTVAGYA